MLTAKQAKEMADIARAKRQPEELKELEEMIASAAQEGKIYIHWYKPLLRENIDHMRSLGYIVSTWSNEEGKEDYEIGWWKRNDESETKVRRQNRLFRL